jgi:hypothetical protein
MGGTPRERGKTSAIPSPKSERAARYHQSSRTPHKWKPLIPLWKRAMPRDLERRPYGAAMATFAVPSTLPNRSSVSYVTVIVNVSCFPANLRSLGTRHEYPQVLPHPYFIAPEATTVPLLSRTATSGCSVRGSKRTAPRSRIGMPPGGPPGKTPGVAAAAAVREVSVIRP